MFEKKLTLPKLIFAIIMLIILCILIAVRIKEVNAPVVLNEKYLSETALNDLTVNVKDIIEKVEIKEGLVICLCTLTDDRLSAFYLEKENNDYHAKVRQIFNTEEFDDNPNKYILFNPFSPKHNDIEVYYSVFINPRQDYIKINQNSIPIKSVKLELNNQEYNIGFWCTDLPKDTAIQFS